MVCCIPELMVSRIIDRRRIPVVMEPHVVLGCIEARWLVTQSKGRIDGTRTRSRVLVAKASAWWTLSAA